MPNEVKSRRTSAKIKNPKLLLLLIFAFFIRLIGLNQSLWLDEAISTQVIANNTFVGIIKNFSPLDFHPPLFYLLLKTWSLFFNSSVITLRLFSVLASIIAAFYLYKTTKLLFNHKIALLATTFLLFNPLFVYYSQELRMYALVTLFLSITTYYFFKILYGAHNMRSNYFLFNLFIFLSFLTFYGSIFYIITLYLILIINKKFNLFFKLIPGFLLSILLISPLLYSQLFLSKTLLRDVTNWSLVLGQANLKNLLLIPIKFSFGRLTFYPKKLYYLVASLWTFSTFFFVLKAKKSKNLFIFFFLPLIFALIISFRLPMLQYFRYLYLLPILSILLAKSLMVQNTYLRSFFLIIFMSLSLIYVLSPNQHREDWQSLANSLPDNSTIYMIPSFADPIHYYRPDIIVNDIRTIKTIKIDHQNTKALSVIPYGFKIFAFDHQPLLKSLNLTNTKTQNFHQINLETWSYLSN